MESITQHLKSLRCTGLKRDSFAPVGLVPGQRIVVKGGAELRYLLPADGQKKKSAGHFHADGKFHEREH